MPAIKPFAVLPLALSSITTGNAKANRPATHLGLPQHAGMRWESSGAGNLWVRGQFSGTQAVNFVSLMAANASADTTIRVRLGASQAEVDGTAPYDSGALAIISPARIEASGLYHSHLEIGTVQNATWWRIDIGGHTGDFSASALIFGLRRQSAFFYNRDREFGFEDLGNLEIARNGVVADTPGAALRTVLFRLGWVSEEEWFNLWEPLGLRNGDSSKRIVFWCFDADPTIRRQSKTYLGYMARDLFMRGNDQGTFNTMDVQFRALDFGIASPPSTLAQLAASPASLAVYDWTSPDTMTSGAGGPVGAGSAIAVVPNVKTPGTLDLRQATATQQPIYNSGAIHDGVNDFLEITFTSGTGPASATLIYVVKTTDTQFMLAGTNNDGRFAGVADNGVATSPEQSISPANYVANGTTISPRTRDGLHDAWSTGAAVIARVDAAPFQFADVSSIRNAYGDGTFTLNGNCMLIAVLNAGHANYSAALALAEQEAARVIASLGI